MNKEKDKVYMNIAREYASFSKCVSMKVGAIFVSNEGRVFGTGVNGTIPGLKNCCEVFHERCPEHSKWSEENEIHAEMNLILDLVRNGGSTSHTNAVRLYCTHNPCENCLKHILALKSFSFNLCHIIFGEQYYRTSDEQLQAMKEKALAKGVFMYELEDYKS